MKKIAIIGAGFAGLAVCSHLLRDPEVSITLFAKGPLASAIAPGLLHPYLGQKAKRDPLALEGMHETLALLEMASAALETQVFRKTGLLRLSASEKQEAIFKKRALEASDIEWWDEEKCQEMGCQGSGIFISSGITVDSQKYLEGLRLSCQRLGAHLKTQQILNLRELDEYDAIVLATGSKTADLYPLPLEPVKGQILKLQWPPSLKPPPMSVMRKKYLVMTDNHTACLVGGTYEHGFASAAPDQEKAKALLLPDICKVYPELEEAPIIATLSGVRAVPLNRAPPHCKTARQEMLGPVRPGIKGPALPCSLS